MRYCLDAETNIHLLPAEQLLVRCISIRAAYGGMAGDVAMLKAFASVWASRCVYHVN